MGELADRLDGMRLRVSTPDGDITADLWERDRLSLAFRKGVYGHLYDEVGLGRRLAVLAQLLWVARTREYWRIYRDVTGDDEVGEDQPAGERDHAWRTERDELVVTGSSLHGHVTVRAVGMRQWEVGIRRGTVQDLDEQQFSTAVGEAAGELIRHQFAEIAALSGKHYGDER